MPFAVKAPDLRGQIFRLGAAVDTILSGHDYSAPVANRFVPGGQCGGDFGAIIRNDYANYGRTIREARLQMH